MAVTGAAATSCPCHVFAQSPPGRHPSDKYCTQSTLRTAPDLCKNVSLAVLISCNGNSHTVSDQSYMYVYMYIHTYMHTHTYTHSSQYMDPGRAEEGTLANAACQRFASPGL
jgi:hypothetical protein